MKEIKFNSQICTSIEQSERLLALGLKKETADMCHIENKHYYNSTEYKVEFFISPIDGLERLKENQSPAWSLHRLWELANIKHIILDSKDEIAVLYDEVIMKIEQFIEEERFNKEYLQEQADNSREG